MASQCDKLGKCYESPTKELNMIDESNGYKAIRQHTFLLQTPRGRRNKDPEQ